MSARVKESLALSGKLERLWADDRFNDGRERGHELREFITAYWVAVYRVGGKEAFDETLRRLAHANYDPEGRHAWRQLLRDDAPRYADVERRNIYRRCPTLKTRGPNAGQPCGKPPARSFRVTNPDTGEWKLQGWCRNHEADGRVMWARERAMTNVPEPMPNVGGLLPSYIKATNWPDLYVSQSSQWKPPYVGIVADDWPVMAKVAKPPLMKVALTSIAGGSELTDAPAPALRLVTS
jgi:hypothetical protein